MRNELIENLETFKKVRSIEEFIGIVSPKLLGKDFLEELTKQDKAWRDNWKGYLSRLIEINKSLIELTEKCAGEERILWVIGY